LKVAKSQTEILSQMIELLMPLSSEDRQRLVGAALTFLGENSTVLRRTGEDQGGEEDNGLSARARTWRKQNGLSMEQLEQVFHIAEGKVEVLEVPGASAREKTINAYVLTGLANYIGSGESKFDDKSARHVCSTSGCYDNTNHAAYLKAKGNLFTGTKDLGWSLTTPGLKHAADLVKALTKQ
jgi:hypothetical protein